MTRNWICIALLAVGVALVFGPWPMLQPSAREIKKQFEGKRVVVCGASMGIGTEIAYDFARAGAHVVVAARRKPQLEAVAERARALGAASVHVHAADLSSVEGARGLIDASVAAMGGIDVLVLNHIVGIYADYVQTIMDAHADGSLEDVLDHAHKIVKVNTMSYIYLSSFALPVLADNAGRIVVVSSAAGKMGLPRVAPYSASKHALHGYFDSLRHDLRASPLPGMRGVSVTLAVLGSFNTETARANTKGMLDHMKWNPPAMAARAIVAGAAARAREVFTPHWEIAPATKLRNLMPSLLDAALQMIIVGGEEA